MKSYSIYGWVRPTMNSPDINWPLSDILNSGGTIFGISTNEIGWGLSNKDTDQFLIALIKPLK